MSESPDSSLSSLHTSIPDSSKSELKLQIMHFLKLYGRKNVSQNPILDVILLSSSKLLLRNVLLTYIESGRIEFRGVRDFKVVLYGDNVEIVIRGERGSICISGDRENIRIGSCAEEPI